MSPRYAHITGWGMAVPEKILTNADLEKMVDTEDEWVVSRTGIRQRHIATDGQTTATLAADAALRALEVANLLPHEVDLIIVSTSSPEHIFPATACLVQDQIRGAEALARLVSWKDRDTCSLFGDAAGAFVLQASKDPGGVLSSGLRSDGSG